jgi:tetratricopeptide (TPR) repeat protein
MCIGLLVSVVATSTLYASDAKTERQKNRLVQELQRFRVYPHQERAYRLLAENRLVEARKELARCLEIDPDDNHVRKDYIVVLHLLGDYEEVVRQTDALLKHEARSLTALLYRGLAWQSLGQLEAAMEDLRIASNLPALADAEKHLVLDTLADMALQRGLYAEALAFLDRLPSSSYGFSHYYRRGVALGALNDPSGAVSSYREAVQVAPSNSDRLFVYEALVEILRKEGDFQQASDALQEAIKLDPEDERLMKALGEISYRMGDDAAAIRWSRQALQSSRISSLEDRYLLQMMLGYAYRRSGGNQAAIESFREATRLKDDPVALLETAHTLDLDGQPERAVEVLMESLRLGESPATHAKLGILYARIDNKDEAIRHLQEAAKKTPVASARADLLEQEGTLYLSMGKPDEARAVFEEALDLTEDRASLYRALGEMSLAEEPQKAVDYLKRSLEIEDEYDTRKSLAIAYSKTGRMEEALAIYSELVAESNGDSLEEQELILKMGQLESDRGRHSQAAKLFLGAFNRGGGSDTLVRAAESLAMAGEWDKAIRVNLRLLNLESLSSSDRAQVFKRLGYAQKAEGELRAATESWRNAFALGIDDWHFLLDSALLLYDRGHWAQAIEHLERSLEQRRVPQTLVYLGRCYQELGKPGVAIYYLEGAMEDAARFESEERKTVLDELSYLYAGQSDYKRASQACERSLAIEPDPMVALRLGGLQRLLGRPQEARDTLESIPVDSLPLHIKADVLDELSKVALAQNEPQNAIELLGQAALLSPAAERDYRLGLLHSSQGGLEEATRFFESAVERAPNETAYQVTLAYAYEQAKRFDEAAIMFEEAVQQEPDYLSVYEDLAYNRMRTGHNDESADWFERAIDNSFFHPVFSEEEKTQQARDLYRMRREVVKLRNRWGINAYFGAAGRGLPGVGAPEGLGGVPLGSYGGIEVTYQPPRIGLRSNRTFQVFTRLLGTEFPAGESGNVESYQAGVGIRYKPFASQNLTVSAERLFGLSGDGIDDWLLRGLYSWDRGYELEAGRSRWTYSYVLGDFGQYTAGPDTFLYGEGRQGLTWNFEDSLLVTPHAIVDAYWNTGTYPSSGNIEGGAGVSLRWLFNETYYQAYRSSLELRLYYKFGRRWTDGISDIFQGWAAVGAFQF